MPTKKSFWGKVSVECHLIKTVSLLGLAVMVGTLVFLRYLFIPTIDVLLQGRTYGEIVNGVSSSFSNEPTIWIDPENVPPVGGTP